MRQALQLLALSCALSFAWPVVVHAQDRNGSSEKASKRSRAKVKKNRKKSDDAGSHASNKSDESADATTAKSDKPNDKSDSHAETSVGASPSPSSDAADASKAASPLAAEAEGDVRKEGGTEVKSLEFTGLDIEGQLKTPQMLYFLNRLRAEFARPRMPHRSFIPELQRETQAEELK